MYTNLFTSYSIDFINSSTYLSITKLVIHTHITVMWHNYLCTYTRQRPTEAHILTYLYNLKYTQYFCLGDNDCVPCAVVWVAADPRPDCDTQNLQISHTKLSVVMQRLTLYYLSVSYGTHRKEIKFAQVNERTPPSYTTNLIIHNAEQSKIKYSRRICGMLCKPATRNYDTIIIIIKFFSLLL